MHSVGRSIALTSVIKYNCPKIISGPLRKSAFRVDQELANVGTE